jgi:hypothetical protein
LFTEFLVGCTLAAGGDGENTEKERDVFCPDWTSIFGGSEVYRKGLFLEFVVLTMDPSKTFSEASIVFVSPPVNEANA